MGLNHIGDLHEYLGLLRQQPEEVKQLAKDLLITVTSFFRDAEMFRLLQTQVIPELLRTKLEGSPVRVWVPGCASGEEAYSMAMLVSECISASQKPWSVQVFATDVDEDSVEMARRGIFRESDMAELDAERVARFFIRIDAKNYQVSKQLRDTVLVARQNLLSDAPFSKLDLISCRNLLMYLEPEVQQKVLLLLHFALKEGGYLVLGPSETVGRYSDLFEPVSKKWRIYRRLGGVRHERVEFPIVADQASAHARAQAAAQQGRVVSASEAAQRVLLEDYAPAAALINRNHEILYFHGATNLYLQQPTGQPTHDLLTLAQEGLRARIRAVLQKARREGGRASVSGARVMRNGQYVSVRITARELHLPRAAEGLTLVAFEDETPLNLPSPAERDVEAQESVVRQVEYELKNTREELQGTIEALESTNEELKASNEEVMSMNEELQSANEELETSKEETQSLNEELTTVNSQLEEKLSELETANNDLANFLNSTDVATLFLGIDHTIKRFTPATTRLFKLLAVDVGRPIEDISSHIDQRHLQAEIDAVLESLSTREQEVLSDDGRWYVRRITPYRTLDNRINGVVIVFNEVTLLKQAEDQLRRLNVALEQRVAQRTEQLETEVKGRHTVEELLHSERTFMAEIVGTTRALVLVTDAQGRILRFNHACEEASGMSFDEVKDRTVYDALTVEEDMEQVKEIFASLRDRRGQAESESTWQHRDGSRRLIAWSNSVLLDAQGQTEYIVRTGVDITRLRQMEQEMRLHQAELTQMHRLFAVGEVASILAHELNQPLTAIASYCETNLQQLRSGKTDPEPLVRNLEQMALQAKRAGRTIRELRSFVSKGEMKRGPVDLNALVLATRDLIAPQARAQRIRIKVDLAETLTEIRAEYVQIEHVLVNLLHNSIEAISSAGMREGVITIRTRMEDAASVRLTVEDSGPGLTSEAMDRIFDPFHTTKPNGLGLGLCISRSIAEAHGGRLWTEPSANGAIFHLVLPVAP
jgi:two-component system CheB/CheR fusion protein